MQNPIKYSHAPIKFAALVVTTVGCVVVLAAPFYLPFMTILGALGTIALSAALLVIFSALAANGFNYVNSREPNDMANFTTLLVYAVSVTLQIIAICSALRLLNAGSQTFFHQPLVFTQIEK